MTELGEYRTVRERKIAEHEAHVAAAYQKIVLPQQASLSLRDTGTAEMN